MVCKACIDSKILDISLIESRINKIIADANKFTSTLNHSKMIKETYEKAIKIMNEKCDECDKSKLKVNDKVKMRNYENEIGALISIDYTVLRNNGELVACGLDELEKAVEDETEG